MELSIEARAVIELVAKNEGKWGWYQLDRELSHMGIRVHVVNLVAELAGRGLLTVVLDDPAYPTGKYSTTPLAQSLLRKG